LVPVFLDALEASAAGADDHAVLHLTDRTVPFVREALSDTHERVNVVDGPLSVDALGIEWEWERAPEVSLVIVDQVADAVEFANRFGPQFVVSVITTDAEEFERCYGSLNAPFVGNGFTRWVDGQYALDRPELGLANWQNGRQIGRGAILSGEGVHTIRYVARITDPSIHR
jgi:glutamate-5-semialdehyde dehydrogenase